MARPKLSLPIAFIIFLLLLPVLTTPLQISVPVDASSAEQFLEYVCARVIDSVRTQHGNSMPHVADAEPELRPQLVDGCRGIIVRRTDIQVEDKDSANKFRIAMDNGDRSPLRHELARPFNINL